MRPGGRVETKYECFGSRRAERARVFLRTAAATASGVRAQEGGRGGPGCGQTGAAASATGRYFKPAGARRLGELERGPETRGLLRLHDHEGVSSWRL